MKAMAWIDGTAYPGFPRIVAPRELHEFYEPSLDEPAWARSLARSSEHVLALVVVLKCLQCLSSYPK